MTTQERFTPTQKRFSHTNHLWDVPVTILLIFFHISPTMVHRYTSILKMIPELQAMANDPDFPFSAFSTAATLTDDDQYILYNKINEFIQGNPGVSITRQNIEAIIKRIKNGTIDKEPLPKTVYLDDYVYKARIQLEKLQASDTAVKDKEQTLAYLHDLEKLIEEVKQKALRRFPIIVNLQRMCPPWTHPFMLKR